MKTHFIIFLFASLLYYNLSFAFADTTEPTRMSKIKHGYGQASFGGGFTGMAVGIGSGIIRKRDNWGIDYLVLINFYRSKNRPDDYEPSSNLLFTNSEYPKDNAYIVAIKLAKEFPTEDKKLRLGVAVGPSYTTYSLKSFRKKAAEISSYESNYETQYNSTNAIGIMLKGSVAFMQKSKFGMQLSAIVNLNAKQCYAGLQYELIWGKLWDKPKKVRSPRQVDKIKDYRFKEDRNRL